MSMEKKWTPGPWVRNKYNDLVGSNGEQVVEYPGVAVNLSGGSEEQRANGIVRDAAPDLVEALEAVEAAWFSDTDEDWLRATRLKDAALAKAYGKDQPK